MSGKSINRRIWRFVSYLLWMALSLLTKNIFRFLVGAFNLITAFDQSTSNLPVLGGSTSCTPQFQRTKITPARVKSTLSSIKRNNRVTKDEKFQGRARRELFRTSPEKFQLENNRTSRLRKWKPLSQSTNARMRL